MFSYLSLNTSIFLIITYSAVHYFFNKSIYIKKYIQTFLTYKPLHNFFYLGLSQGVNVIVPILIIPYLIKTVGIEKFGILAILQTICTFFAILTDYGFNITAVRELSLNRHDSLKIEKIVNQVLSTKLILTVVSLPIFIPVCYIFLKSDASFPLIFMSFSIVAGRAFFPTWLFQGLEKNQYLGYCNLLSKSVFLLCLLLFVKKESDFIWSNFLLGMSNLVFGLGISIYYLKKLKIRLFAQNISIPIIIKQLKDGIEIFLSNFAINSYVSSNILILSLFSSSYYIGIYAIIEKVVALMRVPLEILLQSIYPHACQLVQQKGYSGLSDFLKKMDLLLIAGMCLFCCGVYFFSPYIAYFFSHTNNNYLSKLIAIVPVIPLIVALNISAYITLLSYNFKSQYARILIAGAILSILLSFIFVPKYQITGTIITVITTELVITVSLRLTVYILKIKNKFNEISI